MMHLTEYTLDPNKVLKTYRINSLYVYVSGFLYFVSGVYFSSLLILINFLVAFGLLSFVVIATFFSIIKQLKYKYVFHENFLFVEKGVFSRSKDITEYFRIIDIRKQQPFYLRPFNLAIYHLFTSDVNENKITMKAVLNDDDFLFLKLRELINESRKKYRLLETI